MGKQFSVMCVCVRLSAPILVHLGFLITVFGVDNLHNPLIAPNERRPGAEIKLKQSGFNELLSLGTEGSHQGYLFTENMMLTLTLTSEVKA